MSTDLLKSIDETLKMEITSRHSYFQLKYFIIGKEPTVQARMWQCLRELKTRRDSLVAVNLEIEESNDRVKLLDIDIKRKEAGPDDFFVESDEHKELRKQEHDIRLRQTQRRRKAAEGAIVELKDKRKWLEQEAKFFMESFINLEKIESLKPFDDLEAQKEYWGRKLADKINLKMLLQIPLDSELVETTLALPDGVPIKDNMVKRLNSVQDNLIQLKEEYKKKLENLEN